jgi:hypothetical protein
VLAVSPTSKRLLLREFIPSSELNAHPVRPGIVVEFQLKYTQNLYTVTGGVAGDRRSVVVGSRLQGISRRPKTQNRVISSLQIMSQ